MSKEKVITIEDRIPKLKAERKRKANRRLIFYLSIFFLLIMIFVYFQSPFSKVGQITVKGNHYVPKSEILEVADLSNETSYWNIPKTELEKELVNEISELSNATITKQLPRSVAIQVTEFMRVAYLKENEAFLPILENGQVLKALPAHQVPVNAPILVNWNKKNLENIAKELKKLPQSLIQRISEIHFVSKENASYDLILYMNDGFEVRSTIKNFADKIEKYPSIIRQLDPNKKGIIYLTIGSYFREYDQKEASELESEG